MAEPTPLADEPAAEQTSAVGSTGAGSGPRVTSKGLERERQRAIDQSERLNDSGASLYRNYLSLVILGVISGSAAAVCTALLPNGASRISGAILAAIASIAAALSGIFSARRSADHFELALGWDRLIADIDDFAEYRDTLPQGDAWKTFQSFCQRSDSLFSLEHKGMTAVQGTPKPPR